MHAREFPVTEKAATAAAHQLRFFDAAMAKKVTETGQQRLRELIKQMGIHPEDEHYDVAHAVVAQCAAMVDTETGAQMKRYFGVK